MKNNNLLYQYSIFFNICQAFFPFDYFANIKKLKANN